MRINSDDAILLLAVAIAIAFFAMAVAGSRAISRDGERCKAVGGVQVKTYDGFACLSGPAIENTPAREEGGQ